MYEIITEILALISMFIVRIQLFDIVVPNNILNIFIQVDNLIYIIFVIDYVTRLLISKDKINFVNNNKIDLISLIPFNAIFKSLRILRLNKLLKLAKIIKISVLFARFKDDSDLFFRMTSENPR